MSNEHGHGGHVGPGPANHGFWWLDGPTLYFSHIPGFAVPHDLQTIFSARLSAGEDPREVYERDRATTGADAYTLKSEDMVITELAQGRKNFRASLFRGNFLKDGIEILKDILVDVRELYWLNIFPINGKGLEELEYFLVGSDHERYLIHVITSAPNFEQVLSVQVEGKPPDPFVRVRVEGRADKVESALASGESVGVRLVQKSGVVGDQFQIKVLAELARTTDFLLTETRTPVEPLGETPAPIPLKGATKMGRNQRLLISVFDAQEAREAILGGGRVIDCEDPAGALGDISPQRVMLIADACLGYKRDLEVQISTNIGENQMLFKRDDAGRAVQRFPSEIAGKAAQAALGVAAAMGTDLHPVNIVKVGLDGMPRGIALEALRESVQTLDRSSYFSRSQVVSVFFAQDLKAWAERRTNPFVVRDLLLLREYIVSDDDTGVDPAHVFPDDVPDAVKLNATFMTEFAKPERAGLDERVFLPSDPQHPDEHQLRPGVRLKITELNDRTPLGFSNDPNTYLKEIADLTAEARADGLMLDTRIHSKVARMCCIEYQNDQAPKVPSGLSLLGIHDISDFENAARYCHLKGIEFWASGSIQPWQAQAVWQLGRKHPEATVDAMAVRSGATGPVRGGEVVIDNRASRRVYRDLVEKYAAP